LKTLHKLFIEVGEEYLLLLPECLPFLSELLEDDAADVTTQTGELIRYIEELSGEKLDSYLQ
jgi:U3 small nucleolar RNA-associated protein 10